MATNELANDILNEQITIDDLILCNKESKDNEQQTEYELKQGVEDIKTKEERLHKVIDRLNNIRNKHKYLKLSSPTITFDDGSTYEGGVKNHKLNGFGIFTYANGNIYKEYRGDFKDGEFNGQGILTFASGAVYIGNFKNDEFDGKGKYSFTNGDEYEGQFKDGEFNGEGTLTFADGSVCKGQFKDGKIVDGKGTLIFANGDKYKEYKGQFKDGKFNGRGTLTFANGDIYKGEFKNGEIVDGKGVFIVKKLTQQKQKPTQQEQNFENKATVIVNIKTNSKTKHNKQKKE
ncbi:MAG: hypothetical protein IJ853_02760 [Rickettsiales bacterium]|nr:hypothetical protein [Rickettsiales bacterium]